MRIFTGFFWIVFILLLLTGSCSKENNFEFKKVESLTGQPVEDITIHSSGNVYLSVIDTLLIIVKSEEPFLQVYSTNNHKKLIEFGTTGRGPNEFLSADLLTRDASISSQDVSVISIHDFKRNKIAHINLPELLNKRISDSVTLKNIPNSGNYFTFIHYTDNEYLIATPNSGGILTIYSEAISDFTDVPFLPELDFEVPQSILPIIYRPAVLVNKKRNLIAVAPQHLGEINFFDFEGRLVKSTVFEPRDKHREELSKGMDAFSDVNSDIRYFIIEMDSYKNFIFALNYNIPLKELNAEIWQTKVQVFDWNGNPVKEFNLDGRPVRSFAVDAVHKRIYAYDPTVSENNLVLYNFEF